MKIRTTDRLFYRSFPYKAVIDNEWSFAANCFTIKDIPEIKKGGLSTWGAANRAANNFPNEVIGLIKLLDKYDRTELRRRHEGRGTSLFFKDIKILDELKALSKTEDVVSEFWEPVNADALTYMESNRRVVVKKELTHGCRYKVVLNGSIGKLSPDGKKNFLNLVKRNAHEFHLSDDMSESFKRQYRHFYGHYFYVKDGKFLLMAQMILQPIIKEVVKIVTYDEVKNESTELVT